MTLNTKNIKTESNFVEQPNLTVGSYPARVVRIIDLGLQTQRPFKGQEKKPANMAYIGYELVDAFMVDKEGNEILDKPRWVNEQISVYPLEVENAKSTKRYLAIDPDNNFDGDFGQIIDQPCMVNIVHNSSKNKVYDNVGSISAMRERDKEKTAQLQNPPLVLSLEEDNVEGFLSLPDWIQDIIRDGLKWEESVLYKALQNSSSSGKAEATNAKEPVPAEENDDEDLTDDDIPF